MASVEEEKEGFCDEKNNIKERKRCHGVIHRTQDQTDHDSRNNIINGEDGGFPGRMGFESISPTGHNQKEDGKNEVDPRKECIESFKISKKGKKLQSEEGRKSSCQSDLPNEKRLVIPHHRQEPQGSA